MGGGGGPPVRINAGHALVGGLMDLPELAPGGGRGDVRAVTIPEDAPRGPRAVVVGLWRGPSRLSAKGEKVEQDNRIVAATVVVK